MQILSFPLLLSVVLLALLNNNQAIFLLAALAGSGTGIYGFLLFLRRPHLVCFANLMAVSLLLGYALGTIIYAGGGLFSTADLNMTETIEFGYAQSDLSFSLLLIYVVCSVLFSFSRLESPIFETGQIFASFALPKARLLIWVGIGMVMAAFAVGDLGYMGTQANESLNVTVLGAMSGLLVPILLPMSALCFIDETSRWRRILLFLAFFLFLFSLVLLGRRVLLYSIVNLMIALAVSGRKLPKFGWTKWTAIGLSAIGLMLFLYIGFYFFYALRLSIDNLGLETGLVNLLYATVDLLQNEFSGVGVELSSNSMERPFILSYLAAFVGAQSIYPPLWGEELVYAIKVAIPSLIYPEKTILLPSMVEEFVHPAFGFHVFDGPNSIVTAGLNDFGLIGVLLYPVLLVMAYAAVRRLLYGRLPSFIYYFVMFRLIFQVLYVEQSLAGLLTSALRDLALIKVGLYFICNLPSFKRSS